MNFCDRLEKYYPILTNRLNIEKFKGKSWRGVAR